VFSEDSAQDPRNLFAQQDRELGLVTYLGLPIKIRDEVLGVLTFKTTAPRHYTPDEVAYLTSFADQAAIAIENARLFRGERIRREQLEAIRAVADEITRELDLTALLQLIARRAAELTHVSSSTVWLWDEANQLLTPGAWHGYGAWMRGRRLQLGEGVSGAVAERREGLLVNDYGSSPYRLTAVLEHSKTTAMLAEPLLYRSKLLGVIRIAAEAGEREFTTEDQHLLRLFAAHASIAIENAQLFAELEQSSRDLLVAQEQFVRTEKLRALGRMAAGIAHNLNNTLAAILGQVQLLQLQRVEPAMQEALETLATAASDGAAVVRRLQGFARQQPQHPLLPCDLVALVAEAMALTRPQLRDAPQRRGHVIEVRTALAASGGLPLVLGVPTEIREALTNLILNAVDAMPTGGTLTFSAQVVRTEGEELGNQAITQPGGLEPQIAEVPEGWVDLTVTDTGVGMPDEVRQRIFDPFFTTKGVRGSGLGLSMVYGIMERHGGSIQVASAPGQGTTVTLRFQVARTSTPVPDAAIPLPSGPARRILLIEDDPVVRRTLASLLRTGGHIVEEADGGPAGLTRLTEKPVDLVLTDLGMPELNGWEVARQVKARHPDLPVVLLTGWGEQLEDSGDIPAGLVDRVLGKPVRLEDLLTTIAELTGGSTT
jgi:signal transduction histidine kinase/CheY-like chemotaxis protein